MTTSAPVRRDIQGLRALAVIAVVLAHATGWPRGGFAGVDVFFVVSGFLITGMLLREVAERGRLSLAGFAARRIRRILPAALVVLIAVSVAAFFVFNRTRADTTLGDAVAAFLLVANWRFAAQGTDYFHAGDAVSPLQHFWSLSVEEQFYLVWPLLVLLVVLCLPALRRRGPSARLAVGGLALVVVAASFAWAMQQSVETPTVAYFSTATRAWELAIGALLAAAAPVLARIPVWLRWPLGWIGAAGVVASFFVLDEATTPFPGPGAALPVAAAALVIAGGVGGDARQRHLFPITNPLAVFVGDVSYSLYLWHFPVIVFAAVLLPVGPSTLPIVFAAIVVLSLVSYFGIEQPLHRSPWLRGRAGMTVVHAPDAAIVEPPAAEPAAPAVVEASEPAAPLAGPSRPAGWVPGARYYPGSRPRPVTFDAATPSAEIGPPAIVPAVASVPAAEPAAPAEPWFTATRDASAAEDAPSAPARGGVGSWTPGAVRVREPVRADVDEPAAAAPAPRSWAAWRARFAAQIGLAATGLALGAGAVVVLVFVTVGAPALPAPIAAPGEAVAPAAEDPSAALQSELAAAVTATAWPALSPSLDDVMARSSGDNPAHDCFAPEAVFDAAACTWGSPDAARHMYLVGDSTAMAYAPTFRTLAEQSGGAWRITTLGMYGCRFTDVLIQNSGAGVMQACPQRKSDIRAVLAGDPGAVVVVSNAYTLGRTVDGLDVNAPDLIAASHRELADLTTPGSIVYLAPPPRGGDLSRCYTPVGSPANCVTAVDATWHAMQSAAEAEAAASGDHAISSLPFTCWQEVCPAFAGSTPLRYDENHFTVAYAERLVPELRYLLSTLGIL